VSSWSSTGASWAGLHVLCAVLAWSRFPIVRCADNERAATMLGMLAECFELESVLVRSGFQTLTRGVLERSVDFWESEATGSLYEILFEFDQGLPWAR
jgi:hypothetical protein